MAGGSLPRRDGHSSGTRIAARLEQPTRTTGLRNQPLPACAESVVPIRFCSRWGLPCRPRCRVRGALLPHLFTLTSRKRAEAPGARRFDLCGAFPGVAPAGRYPAPCFRGARTFLPRERERPSGRLARGRCALARPASSLCRVVASVAGRDRAHLGAIGAVGAAHPGRHVAALIFHDGPAGVAAGEPVGLGEILHRVARIGLRIE